MAFPNLYPKNCSPSLDPDLFRNPTAEYRGTPLWSWNNKLDRDQLLRQIGYLQEMGLGGFHIHVRTGLDTPYLGEEYLSHVVACMEEARQREMLCWLYDEDRWPSGFGGGLVTQEEKYRSKYLLWTKHPYRGERTEADNISNSYANRNENGVLIGAYEIELVDGCLSGYRRIEGGDERSCGTIEQGNLHASTPTRFHTWYAYLETSTPIPWYNNQTYVDTLNKEAIQRFIEVTHERYKEFCAPEFGGLVPAIFTDEPQFIHKRHFKFAEEDRDLFLPWTTDLADTYRAAFGEDLLDKMPELFWELPDRVPSLTRYRYHDHICQRFTEAFADTIGEWCERSGLPLTGHMMLEETLGSQTLALGEAMRSYRAFHIPGIDLLCDARDYTTAKQAQSACHQYGRPGVMSELYGVTNWDFDFVGHKGQGDWQAALGITVRVPHLTWVTMAGEAKRDYPACIGYQSPWYREYPLIEDHFARVHTVLSRGKPLVRVGVIHSIESYWLCFGPSEQTKLEREEREAAFKNTSEWLMFGLIDFDFIAESLLPELTPPPVPSPSGDGEGGAPTLHVGEMSYDAVVVPAMRTIRAVTIERLEAFADAGGEVIFAGEVPSLVDAQPSDSAQVLAQRCTRIELTRTQLMLALEKYREIDVRLSDGGMSDSLLHQIRQDGDVRHIFICNTDRKRPRLDSVIRVRGRWQAKLLDTSTGDISDLPATVKSDWTEIPYDFQACGHALLGLAPNANPNTQGLTLDTKRTGTEIDRLSDPVPVSLHEPNVLLLDQAEYRLDGGEWQVVEEVLRIENVIRKHVGMPKNDGSIAQPWTDTRPVVKLADVELRFRFRSEVAVEEVKLALEPQDGMRVTLDGREIALQVDGWWVDEAIKTVPAGSLAAGEHELIVAFPFTRKTAVEWCYILGDFGVQVAGRHAWITEPVRELAWGDWTTQGLPFYAGNVTYHATLPAPSRRVGGLGHALSDEPSDRGLGPSGVDSDTHREEARASTSVRRRVRFAHFKAPLLSVDCDGELLGKVAFPPFEINVQSGEHRLDVTAYGNRANAFGQLHNCNPNLWWPGPASWRSDGDHWCYEYRLKPMGVLVAPVVLGESG